MSELDQIERTGRPGTVESLRDDLHAIGVADGDVLIVHASLRSLGWVAGGATSSVPRAPGSRTTVACMGEKFELVPIGTVHCTRSDAQDDRWDAETASIELLAPFGERSLLGLADFSHCIVVYVFDQASWDEAGMSRHPRSNCDWPETGIFAQRAKDRPNRLGVTVCRVLGVAGSTVHVGGLDAIDRTPVVDIKPWMQEFGPRGTVTQPAWSSELMARYW